MALPYPMFVLGKLCTLRSEEVDEILILSDLKRSIIILWIQPRSTIFSGSIPIRLLKFHENPADISGCLSLGKTDHEQQLVSREIQHFSGNLDTLVIEPFFDMEHHHLLEVNPL
jgi:hypothetical protein